MATPTTEQIKEKLRNKEITGLKLNDGTTYRLFISSDDTGNRLCYYPKGYKRRGYPFHDYLLNDFKCFTGVAKDGLTELHKEYNMLFKYRELAKSASFENRFIRECLAIPDSYDKWIAEGKKSLYEYNVTTGNRIDGKVVTLASVQKEYPYIAEAFLSAFYNKVQYHSGQFDFRGYDGSVSVSVDSDGNSMGHLAMEFKGTGNGYYYLLINDFKFIGYDVD